MDSHQCLFRDQCQCKREHCRWWMAEFAGLQASKSSCIYNGCYSLADWKAPLIWKARCDVMFKGIQLDFGRFSYRTINHVKKYISGMKLKMGKFLLNLDFHSCSRFFFVFWCFLVQWGHKQVEWVSSLSQMTREFLWHDVNSYGLNQAWKQRPRQWIGHFSWLLKEGSRLVEFLQIVLKFYMPLKIKRGRVTGEFQLLSTTLKDCSVKRRTYKWSWSPWNGTLSLIKLLLKEGILHNCPFFIWGERGHNGWWTSAPSLGLVFKVSCVWSCCFGCCLFSIESVRV